MTGFVQPISFLGMSFGYSEMVFIFIIVLIVFGPKKLPEIFRTVSGFMNQMRKASWEFKQQVMEVENEIRQEVREIEATIKQEIDEASTEFDEAASDIADATHDALHGNEDDHDDPWHNEIDDYHLHHDDDGNPIHPELNESTHHDDLNLPDADPETFADRAAEQTLQTTADTLAKNASADEQPSGILAEAGTDDAVNEIDRATQPTQPSPPASTPPGDLPDFLQLPGQPPAQPTPAPTPAPTPIARGKHTPATDSNSQTNSQPNGTASTTTKEMDPSD